MITKSEKAYFRAAKAVSELSDHHTHHLGCVVVDKHKIISSGYNSSTKTNPLQVRLDAERFDVPSPGKLHAEVSALIPLIKNNVDLSNSEVYVYREHKNGRPALARPCPGCMKLIKSYGIKKINYTTEDGYASEVIEAN